eukprot:8763381-Karenia_brevis.AAC.1
MKWGLDGGMKRARGSQDGKADKNTKITQVREEIGTLLLRLQAGQQSPQVSAIGRAGVQMSQAVNTDGVNVMKNILQHRVSHDQLKTIAKAIAASGNNEHRITCIAKVFFGVEQSAITQLEMEVVAAKKLMKQITELMVFTSYMSDNGMMDWQRLSDDVLNALTVPQQPPANGPANGLPPR